MRVGSLGLVVRIGLEVQKRGVSGLFKYFADWNVACFIRYMPFDGSAFTQHVTVLICVLISADHFHKGWMGSRVERISHEAETQLHFRMTVKV